MSTSDRLPTISIVVPVRNGERELPACLDALARQRYPAELSEVVVVDNASTDGTGRVAAGFPVRVETEPRRGRSYARNRGILASEGELVAFVDCDCVPDDSWLAELVAGFDGAEVGAVAGEIHELEPSTPAQAFMARRQPRHQGVVLARPRPFAITANAAFRRTTFARVGHFDPEFVTAEDVDFGWRLCNAGLEIRYRPEAIVRHRLRATGWQLFVQQVGYGYGRAHLRRRYGLPRGYSLGTYRDLAASAGRAGRALVDPRRTAARREPAYELAVRVGLRVGAAGYVARRVPRALAGR